MDTTNIFTVTPMSQNVKLEAGQVYNGSITVANPANATSDFHYKVEVSPYSVVGEEYSADLETISNRSQITNWIKVENPSGVLKPNETADIKFKITVPETAPAGGQYAALMVSSNNSNKASEGLTINNIFEMASLIYANVAGETVHDGEVSEITIPGFVTTLPIETSAVIVNRGNTHETAHIALEVKNIFSDTPIYPAPGEDDVLNEVIMPETTRLIKRNIEGISPLGIYQVKETVNYLGKNTTFSQTVVACPVWFMALLIVTITGVVITIVHSIRARRAKHRIF